MQAIERWVSKIVLEPERGKPLSLCLAEAVERLIETGSIEPGAVLPSTRRLAGMVGVSVQVAQEAGMRLADRGLVERRRRAGTVVSGRASTRILGLLTAVDLTLSPMANVGWVIAQAFMASAERHAHGFRQYLVRGDTSGRPALPENLVADLRNRALDAVLVGAVYGDIVRQHVPTSTPVHHLDPDGSGLAESLEDAARWLWRHDTQRPALVLESVAVAPRIEAVFSAACAAFRMPLAPDCVLRDLPSRIAQGKVVYDRLMRPGNAPDGLVIMDDMVGYGFLQEVALRGGPDPARIVIMTNKGSALHIDERCPQIPIDWGVVVEKTLARAIDEPVLDEAGKPVYRFVPPERNGTTADGVPAGGCHAVMAS